MGICVCALYLLTQAGAANDSEKENEKAEPIAEDPEGEAAAEVEAVSAPFSSLLAPSLP